jgi:hypothetical protein
LALFAGAMFASHAWLLRLPYFWDEAGQFVPTALDLMKGMWVSESVPPAVHPPGVPAYLAVCWMVAGFTPLVTRAAMLLLASLSLLAAFLLAIELCRDVPGRPALFAVALLFVSPLFFAQSLLAQLDAPAMLFTTLALLFFVQDHIRWSGAACVVLVLVKETGVALPLVLMVWLALERRWRDAAWFLPSFAGLGIWLLVLARGSGTWAGNRDFLWYNLYYPLHPVRLTLAFLRRIFFLGFAHLHIIGIGAIVYACRRTRMFSSRAWRVTLVFSAVHVVVVTALGGAVLERYLLPIMPVFYTAIAAALTTLGRKPRVALSAALLLALAAGIYVNPPYSAPLEDNLAFVDYVKLHVEAAEYLERWYPGTPVHAVWPFWLELARPELGYVNRPIPTETVHDVSPAALAAMDWSKVRILIVCNQNLGSRIPLLKQGWIGEIRKRFYTLSKAPEENAIRLAVPFRNVAHFQDRGQWVDIYVNPDVRVR